MPSTAADRPPRYGATSRHCMALYCEESNVAAKEVKAKRRRTRRIVFRVMTREWYSQPELFALFFDGGEDLQLDAVFGTVGRAFHAHEVVEGADEDFEVGRDLNAGCTG